VSLEKKEVSLDSLLVEVTTTSSLCFVGLSC
jgi:hypothetical protein